MGAGGATEGMRSRFGSGGGTDRGRLSDGEAAPAGGMEAREERAAAIAALESSGNVKAGAHSFKPSRQTNVEGAIFPLESAERSSLVSIVRSTPCSSVNRHSWLVKARSPARGAARAHGTWEALDCEVDDATGGESCRQQGMDKTSALVLARRAVRRGLELAGDWLAPPACAACDEPCRPTRSFCDVCQVSLEPAEPGKTFCAFGYGGALRSAVIRLKYEGRSDLGRPLGRLLLAAARGAVGPADLVVPVPLHPVRLAERGYNQATLLAREVAPELGSLSIALRRREARHRQATLGREDRLSNLQGAFVASPRAAGRSVLLVDDVCTTGATLAACEAALRAAGASAVHTIALARTEA